MRTKTFAFPATQHATMKEAISAVRGTNARRAIILGNRYLALEKSAAERLEANGHTSIFARCRAYHTRLHGLLEQRD